MYLRMTMYLLLTKYKNLAVRKKLYCIVHYSWTHPIFTAISYYITVAGSAFHLFLLLLYIQQLYYIYQSIYPIPSVNAPPMQRQEHLIEGT